jgi:hypothetical protein
VNSRETVLLLSPHLSPLTPGLIDGFAPTETLLANPCLVGVRVVVVSLSGVKYDIDVCLLGAPGFRTKRVVFGGASALPGDSERGEGVEYGVNGEIIEPVDPGVVVDARARRRGRGPLNVCRVECVVLTAIGKSLIVAEGVLEENRTSRFQMINGV